MSSSDDRGERGGEIASVHVCDFSSPLKARRWASRAAKELDATPGVRFAKPMRCFGTRSSAGFNSRGIPYLRRVITLLTWREEAALDEFLDKSPLARVWEDCRWAWHLRGAPLQFRGTFRGVAPLAAISKQAADVSSATEQSDPAPQEEPIAIVTLGRTALRSTRAFARAAPPTKAFLQTRGLITAVSAGTPARGIFTLTLWDSEDDAQAFAYGETPGDHRQTMREDQDRAIVIEQFSVRFKPTGIGGSWDPASTPHASALERFAGTLSATS
jgi:heme-degrading monooxygenase HmoA